MAINMKTGEVVDEQLSLFFEGNPVDVVEQKLKACKVGVSAAQEGESPKLYETRYFLIKATATSINHVSKDGILTKCANFEVERVVGVPKGTAVAMFNDPQ